MVTLSQCILLDPNNYNVDNDSLPLPLSQPVLEGILESDDDGDNSDGQEEVSGDGAEDEDGGNGDSSEDEDDPFFEISDAEDDGAGGDTGCKDPGIGFIS